MKLLFCLIGFGIMTKVHSPAVAGQFYPSDADTLKAVVDGFLDSTSARPQGRVQAVIVPHAGYVFSGAVAAEAYASIAPTERYERVFLVGPSHREAFRGASVDVECDWYETPLGRLRVDTEVGFELIGADSIFRDFHNAHVREHCLEVQLPFLQERLREVPSIVPIIIGSVDGGGLRRIARVLGPYMNEDNLFVISSDFSHYPSYEDACRVDGATGEAIASGSVDRFLDVLLDNARAKVPNLATSACGQLPIAALLMMMEGRDDLEIRHLDYRNSGDAAVYGDKSEVVGYHAFSVVYKEGAEKNTGASGGFSLTAEEREVLLETARRSIETAFDGKYWLPSDTQLTQTLKAECGAFVTLHLHGRLRGCIGNIVGVRPLYKTVAEMARAAAFEDDRFRPLTREELEQVHIEISVLSPLRQISSPDEIVLGRDGVLMVKDGRSGTFLPQVADETGWTREEFLGHCARDKAGIGWNGWKDADLYVYQAEVFDER